MKFVNAIIGFYVKKTAYTSEKGCFLGLLMKKHTFFDRVVILKNRGGVFLFL